MKAKILGFLAAGLFGSVCLVASDAVAAPITYSASATGSFSLGQTGYENALVTVTATGDSDVAPTSGSFQSYVLSPVSISIAGVGSGSFTAVMNVFVNQSFSPAAAVGFGTPGVGTFLALLSPAASTYNLDQVFGPTSGSSFIRTELSWDTSLGIFQWRNAGNATFSTTLTAVPEPGTLALLGLGLAGLGLSWRRRSN